MNYKADVVGWYSNFVKPETYITSKKSRLKVYYGKNIYLKDGTNFEIELHNPTSVRYMAKIWINGKPVSNSGLVVKPKDRIFLERFIDESAKFEFKTFEVDDVTETKAAREKNGLVRVEFYPEIKKIEKINYLTTFEAPEIKSSGVYFNPKDKFVGLVTTSFYSSTTFSGPNNRGLLNETVESGRVEKGEKSNQKLSFTAGDFYETPYYTYEVHLLPESLKAVEAGEIRNYCIECGTRVKKTSWKFCPNCGEKL